MSVFKIHKDSKIAFKAITLADLGWSGPSNQTHIGLQYDALNMLNNNVLPEDQIWYDRRAKKMRYDLDTILIYKDQIYEADGYISYIKDDDGLRSPKLNKTGNPEWIYSEESIYTKIENIAAIDKRKDEDLSHERRKCTYWWIIYFVLENYQLCFFLVKKDRNDSLFNKIINWSNKAGKILDYGDDHNAKKILADSLKNFNILIDLPNERLTTIPTIESEKILKKLLNKEDRAKAREAEKLVSNYLSKQKKLNKIKDFDWINEKKERLKPYDFIITDRDNKIIFSDSKYTKGHFDASFYISKNELKHINQQNNYHIYRVFEKNDKTIVRVCDNIYLVAKIFSDNYKKFEKSLGRNNLRLLTDQYSITVSPKTEGLNWSKEIKLK